MSKANMAAAPIGIFDSGIGGLTVARAIKKLLPHESFIYFGDTEHMPYGDKSAEAIKHFCLKISEMLIAKGCKMLVIACNTASAAAFKEVSKEFSDIPVVNVIDPVVTYVAKNKSQHKIGVIGTKRTIGSNVYQKKLKQKIKNAQVTAVATPLLAPMIEEGFFNNKISQAVINSYLDKPRIKDVDSIILGCTHYPLIKEEIRNYYGTRVEIVDSSQIVAKNVYDILAKHGLLNLGKKKSEYHFYVSDFTPSFQQTTKLFFKEKIKLEQLKLWGE